MSRLVNRRCLPLMMLPAVGSIAARATGDSNAPRNAVIDPFVNVVSPKVDQQAPIGDDVRVAGDTGQAGHRVGV